MGLDHNVGRCAQILGTVMEGRCALTLETAMEDRDLDLDRDLEDRKGDRLSHTDPRKTFKISDEALLLVRNLANPGVIRMVASDLLGVV